MKYKYVVTYLSESGDRGIIGLFNQMPSDRHIATVVRDRFSGDVDIEDNITYLSWEVHMVEEEDLPEPSDPLQHL